jgi:uncharacterized protein DUF397
MGKQRQQQLESAWRKPRRSGTNGNCVETASGNRTVFVRDSKNPEGVTLSFTADAWAEFNTSLR